MIMLDFIYTHHDIAEILLNLALNTNQSINQSIFSNIVYLCRGTNKRSDTGELHKRTVFYYQ